MFEVLLTLADQMALGHDMISGCCKLGRRYQKHPTGKGPPMFTANYDDSTFSYWISETDAEGVGEQKIQIRSVGLDKNVQLVEQVSRLVLNWLRVLVIGDRGVSNVGHTIRNGARQPGR